MAMSRQYSNMASEATRFVFIFGTLTKVNTQVASRQQNLLVPVLVFRTTNIPGQVSDKLAALEVPKQQWGRGWDLGALGNEVPLKRSLWFLATVTMATQQQGNNISTTTAAAATTTFISKKELAICVFLATRSTF